MAEWRPSYSPKALWALFVCLVCGHDWDYFTLTKLDGTPANFRCCLRCERSDELGE